jgi:hypothetical protein
MKQTIDLQREGDKVFFTLDEHEMSLNITEEEGLNSLLEDSIEAILHYLWGAKDVLRHLKEQYKNFAHNIFDEKIKTKIETEKTQLETIEFNFYDKFTLKADNAEESILKLYYEIQRHESIIRLGGYILRSFVEDIELYFQTT